MKNIIHKQLTCRPLPGGLGYLLLGALLLCFAFQSCKKELFNAHGTVTATPVLKTSTDSVTLQQQDTAQTALTLTWSAAGVSGSTGQITYILQFGKKGDNFSNSIDIKLNAATTKMTYTVKQLNNLLGAYPINTPTAFDVRVVAATTDGAIMPVFSNVVSINITTFADVPYHKLWLMGDATPGGWGLSTLTPMVESSSDPFTFTYTGNFVPGEFKVATAANYNAPFYRPTTNHPTLSATAVQVTAGDPDNKWLITEQATYSITLNTKTNTIAIVEINAPKPPYPTVSLVGDATAGGWDLSKLTPMAQSKTDPFIFTFSGALATGEFKIATAASFSAPFYRPTINHPDLSATSVQVTAGDPDNKWQITDAGTYTITLNERDNTISIVEQPKITTPPYSKLWLIGDATPGGWSLNAMTPMVQSGSNPFIFTYTGAFVAGEFKIATTNDFNAPFYRPTTNHPDLSATAVQVTAGDPDNKWQITTATAGKYKITLDTQHNTITITQQ
ncbi:MAG: SusF/SusE family outer membrane protein, partial [Mucilaginibacter sp.]